MRRIFAFLLIISIVLPVAQCGLEPGEGGPDGGSVGSTAGSGGGGGGHKQIDLDKILKAVQDGKKKKPDKFEELKTILWKDPVTSEEYMLPVVLMKYEGNNTTVTRNQPLDIITIATNNNPLEMRRMLDLYLEVKNPGSDKYERLNSWPEKIQTNEYSEKTNTTLRIWGDLPSFSYLKTVGTVKVRVNVSDGVNRWSTASYRNVRPPYYGELIFNVINSQPTMSNFTVVPAGQVRYNDPIEYRANIADPDGDTLNVTLHILDERGTTELRNETQEIKGGGAVSFKANEYGFFSEADSGKNFTYYYSFDDGINSSRTEIQPGPFIRRGPKLFVDKLDFTAESENYFWWQWYTFNVRVKNLNPEEFDVTFTLYTDTKNNPGKVIESKTVRIGPESQVISFNKTKPFVVTDANESFSYKIKFSEYDQSGKDFVEAAGPRINSKIVPYTIYNPVMIFNLALVFVVVVGGGLFIERTLKRGIESHERSSGKLGGANKQNGFKSNGFKSGNGIVGKISKLFRRRD